MNPALRVDVTDTRGQTTALAVTGELDLATATRFFRDVGDVLGSHLTVILNLAGVTFCDSSGLNTLLRLRRRAQDTGCRIVLVAPPAQMTRLLTVTGAAGIFTIHGTLAEAWETHTASGTPPTA